MPPTGRIGVFVSAPPESIRRPVSPDSKFIAFSAAYADAGPAEPAQVEPWRSALSVWTTQTGPTPRAGRCGLVRADVRVDAAADGLRRLPCPPDSPIGFLGTDAATATAHALRHRRARSALDPVLTATPDASALNPQAARRATHGGRARPDQRPGDTHRGVAGHPAVDRTGRLRHRARRRIGLSMTERGRDRQTRSGTMPRSRSRTGCGMRAGLMLAAWFWLPRRRSRRRAIHAATGARDRRLSAAAQVRQVGGARFDAKTADADDARPNAACAAASG